MKQSKVLFFAVWVLFWVSLPSDVLWGQDRALTRLNRYLCARQAQTAYNLRFLAVWLSSRYGTSSPQKCLEAGLDRRPDLPEDEAVFDFYAPLLGLPIRQSADSLLRRYERSDSMERLLLWAANPQQLPLDEHCRAVLSECSRPGANTRQAAHAALALCWVEGRADEGVLGSLVLYKRALTLALETGLGRELPGGDSWMEGIIGLICLERRDRIPARHVKTLLRHQRRDGGWAWEPGQASQPHPSVLALWILLDYRRHKRFYGKF